MTTPKIVDAGFTLAGNYPETDPAAGLEDTLRLFEFAEEIGLQVAGIRQRHLERGVSSALTFLAAATQRTETIRLETAVVPLGYETPFRLAEDFGTVDALSKGRLNVGVSSSAPHGALLRHLGRIEEPGDIDAYALIARFLEALEGHALGEDIPTPYGPQTPRVQPHIAGLRDRVWLGGGSARSVRWAAEQGLKLLLGNITSAAEGSEDFETAQRVHIDDYHAHFAGSGSPAVGVERVIIPLDSATADQRERYTAFAASRQERTLQPVNGHVFQRDLFGTADEIVERLLADPAFDGLTELRVALPYALSLDDYRQILSDIRHAVLPRLGWVPAASALATTVA
jgi:alkanesulfonate monooxygenase SsuD/methylene tetrahydromethanopterin reductase-like flavin-dependent oxidoreductase (luciferase family)